MTRFALTRTTPLLLSMLALAACPSDDTPIDTEGTSTSDGDTTMAPPTTMTMPTTVDPDSTSAGDTVEPTTTTGDPVCEPACELGECCVAGNCFDAGPPTCDAGCADNEDCVCPEGADPCECASGGAECVPAECGVAGGYDPCFDDECPAGYICVVDNVANPSVSWCALDGCLDPCDCPVPAEGFDAVCDDIIGEPTSQCLIDCGAGGACPEGMTCFQNIACVWPAEGVEPEPQYGDCLNGGPCDAGLQCVSDGMTYGWCATIDCADDMVCQPPPATGDAPAVCQSIGMADACVLDCSDGQTCPDGMSCFMDALCVWGPPPPPPAPGYDPCVVPETGCAAGETCLDDGAMEPAWEVCAQGCTDIGDCTLLAPATGDAPIACGDPGGSGTDSCFLDCSAGQTCPDGMECINDALCAWPLGMELFADDFESGDLSAGWTLENVDGLNPDPTVAFVDDAWVVEEIDDGNLTAVSTSWYAPAGTSDDWLISPQIMLGANTRLYWYSRSFDAGFPDDLEVRISTATAAVADFEANPALYTAAPESLDFTLHYVDLAPGYMNQPVYIAFRNTTFDGNLLLVDNVLVAELP